MDYTQSGQASNTFAKSIPPRPQPTFTEQVDMAANDVRALSVRVESLATRLCGSIPQAESANSLNAVPDGVFDSISGGARRIQSDVHDCNAAIERIERALP